MVARHVSLQCCSFVSRANRGGGVRIMSAARDEIYGKLKRRSDV